MRDLWLPAFDIESTSPATLVLHMTSHQEHLNSENSRGVSFGEPSNPWIFPNDLLNGFADRGRLIDGNANWWLIYTKSRQEKVLAQQLFAQEVPFYLPVIRRRSLSRGRVRNAIVPLFPGYLFLYGTGAHRLAACALWTIHFPRRMEKQCAIAAVCGSAFAIARK